MKRFRKYKLSRAAALLAWLLVLSASALVNHRQEGMESLLIALFPLPQ